MNPVDIASAHIAPQKSRKRLFIIIGIIVLLIGIGGIAAMQLGTTNESTTNNAGAGATQESVSAPAVQDTQESAATVDTSSTQLDGSLSNAESALKNESDYQKVGE